MGEKEEKVVLQELSLLDASQQTNIGSWPPQELLEACLDDENDATTSTLQQGARSALLEKYGYESWDSLLLEITRQESDEQECNENDLVELFKTGKSNQRPLQWALMTCAPACQFRLHAHPNIELVYCVKGALHEIRMEGLPFTRTFDTDASAENKLIGPSVTQLQRPWKFGSLKQGEWLVNEVGSIHKSFTATNGGCKLLVLWGGSHANIPEEPSLITDAVSSMDERICSCRNNGATISETFLPASERSKATL